MSTLRTIGDGSAESHLRYNRTVKSPFKIGTGYAEIHLTTRATGKRVRRGSTFITAKRFAILLTIARNPAVIGDTQSSPITHNPTSYDGDGGLIRFSQIATNLLSAVTGLTVTDESKTAYHTALDAVKPTPDAVKTVKTLLETGFYPTPKAKPETATDTPDTATDTPDTPDNGDTATDTPDVN